MDLNRSHVPGLRAALTQADTTTTDSITVGELERMIHEALKPPGGTPCQARQTSDQMTCSCGNVWDMNDPYPPECKKEPTMTTNKPEVVARLLTWAGPRHEPVPWEGVCARTFAEFPLENPFHGRWKEGEPLIRLSDYEVLQAEYEKLQAECKRLQAALVDTGGTQ